MIGVPSFTNKFSGIGKTTLTKKICEALMERKIPVVGFYTEEVRDGGRRIGFDIVDIHGKERKPLARMYVCIIDLYRIYYC